MSVFEHTPGQSVATEYTFAPNRDDYIDDEPTPEERLEPLRRIAQNQVEVPPFSAWFLRCMSHMQGMHDREEQEILAELEEHQIEVGRLRRQNMNQQLKARESDAERYRLLMEIDAAKTVASLGDDELESMKTDVHALLLKSRKDRALIVELKEEMNSLKNQARDRTTGFQKDKWSKTKQIKELEEQNRGLVAEMQRMHKAHAETALENDKLSDEVKGLTQQVERVKATADWQVAAEKEAHQMTVNNKKEESGDLSMRLEATKDTLHLLKAGIHRAAGAQAATTSYESLNREGYWTKLHSKTSFPKHRRGGGSRSPSPNGGGGGSGNRLGGASPYAGSPPHARHLAGQPGQAAAMPAHRIHNPHSVKGEPNGSVGMWTPANQARASAPHREGGHVYEGDQHSKQANDGTWYVG